MILKYRFSIFSEDPDKLANFYINSLGMKMVVKVDRPDDYGYGIEATKGYKIWIAKHSLVTSTNKDSFRHILTLYVDNVQDYFNKLSSEKSIEIIQKPELTCKGIIGEERIIFTFLDPDKNCVQLMQLTGN